MRISGFVYHHTVDEAWETFWQYISASIGLTLTSIAAFRSLFISYNVSHRQQETSDLRSLRLLYVKIKQALSRIFSIQTWRMRAWFPSKSDSGQTDNADHRIHLGSIEKGTITGLKTFVRQYQREPATVSQMMYSQTGKEVDETKTWLCPDHVVAMDAPSSRKQGKTIGSARIGRHEKILAHKESRRHDKILAHRGSRKHDKMLNSLESRKHDKMPRGQENDDPDKILATNGNCEHDIVLAKPKRIRKAPDQSGNSSFITTGDCAFNEIGAWRGSARERMMPKSGVGLTSNMRCGCIVFSAGFKAERYKEAK